MRRKLRKTSAAIFRNSRSGKIQKILHNVRKQTQGWGVGLRSLRVECSAIRWKREKNSRENLSFHARDSRRKNFFASNFGNGSRASFFKEIFFGFHPLEQRDKKMKKKKRNEGWLRGWVKIGKNKKTSKRLPKWQRKEIWPGCLLINVLGDNY